MRRAAGLAPRWAAPLFALLALALLPWTVWLAGALPDQHVSAHWNVAWTGFDLALAGARRWRRCAVRPGWREAR